MKNFLIISFWILSILLLSFVMVSFGYSFLESLFIATLFLPGAVAVKFMFPKISFTDKTKGIVNIIYVIIGIIIVEILFFSVAHYCVILIRDGNSWSINEPPDVMYNPVFIAIMIGALSVGNYFFEKGLDKIIHSEVKPITFLSDRKPISILRNEIIYIESNDSVTTVYATKGCSFKNSTSISQWETFLGDGFIRIHRSYLVNVEHISEHNADSVTVNDTELPISRKYRETIKSILYGPQI